MLKDYFPWLIGAGVILFAVAPGGQGNEIKATRQANQVQNVMSKTALENAATRSEIALARLEQGCTFLYQRAAQQVPAHTDQGLITVELTRVNEGMIPRTLDGAVVPDGACIADGLTGATAIVQDYKATDVAVYGGNIQPFLDAWWADRHGFKLSQGL